MIVKTDRYTREKVGKIVQLRALVERLKLGEGIIDRLAAEGDKSTLRYGMCLAFMPVPIIFAPGYALQLLTPPLILAQLAGEPRLTWKR